MGKHHIKCLKCRREKDHYPEVRFFSIPSDTERREIWLTNLNLTHLIDVKISADHRICEDHFASNMIAKSGARLTVSAVPTKVDEPPTEMLKVLDDSQLISPKNPEEIGIIRNDVFMDQQIPGTSKNALVNELPGSSNVELSGGPNDYNQLFIVPTTHQSIEQRIISYVIEDEINKLRKECGELRKENAELRNENTELRKEKDSDTFYIERTRRLLPEELARIVESHISNLHDHRQGWRQLRETEYGAFEQPAKKRRLPSSNEIGLVNSESSLNKSDKYTEIEIKNEIEIKEEPLDDNTDEDIKPDIGELQLQVLDTIVANAQNLLEIKPDPDGNGSEAKNQKLIHHQFRGPNYS